MIITQGYSLLSQTRLSEHNIVIHKGTLYKPDETIGAQYRHTQGYSFLVILKNIACSSKLILFNDSINSVSIAR